VWASHLLLQRVLLRLRREGGVDCGCHSGLRALLLGPLLLVEGAGLPHIETHLLLLMLLLRLRRLSLRLRRRSGLLLSLMLLLLLLLLRSLLLLLLLLLRRRRSRCVLLLGGHAVGPIRIQLLRLLRLQCDGASKEVSERRCGCSALSTGATAKHCRSFADQRKIGLGELGL
jgi:hypothetical protein